MKPSIACALILCLAVPSFAVGINGNQDFQLTASAPSTRYWLLCDPRQQLPGNAAFLYADAQLLLSDDITRPVDDALDAYDASDWKKFDSLAAQIDQGKTTGETWNRQFDVQNLFDLLDVAARREDYDWSSSAREQGFAAPLSHLHGERELGGLIKVRAVQQIRAGKFPDALNSLRLQFELGHKVGREGFLVTGLVGINITVQGLDATAELMKQPRSPNLYWALASLPRPFISFQNACTYEVRAVQETIHELAPDRLPNLSAGDWHQVFNHVAALCQMSGTNAGPAESHDWSNDQTVTNEVARTLPQARQYFAETYQLSSDQVAALEPFKVVATYWFAQEQKQLNLAYDMASLPYPLLLPKERDWDSRLHQLRIEQPANIFWSLLPSFTRAATAWMRLDRALAALTDVEAIRSYAAAHDGQLPSSLDQITDTPALDNPRTGKPFTYVVQDQTASLSDPDPDLPLTYTIRIRK